MGEYRSVHIIYRYTGKEENSVFDGRKIELQLRTRLQHSWATAVEAIGLFNNEDMKAGEGDQNWLRFFELIAAEFACAEDRPEPDGVPSRELRVEEIKHLNHELGASEVLDGWRFDSVPGRGV